MNRMEEESKSRITYPPQKFDFDQHDKTLKARINNNSQYQRGQALIFRNISQIDRLIAYSLNSNCQSLEKVKQKQIQSLIHHFNQSNMEAKHDGKKRFRQIIRNRFQNVAANNEDEVQISASNEESDNSFDDDEDEEDEEDDDLVQQQEENDQEMQQPEETQVANQRRVHQSQPDDEEDDNYYESDEDVNSEDYHSSKSQ